MKVREAIRVMMVLPVWARLARTQANAPLKLEQTIPLPDIQGRIDHLSLDVRSQAAACFSFGQRHAQEPRKC